MNELITANIKNWYRKTYPTDEIVEYIDKNISFLDVYIALNIGKDFYEIIGDVDSLVRERVFEKLAEIMNCDYNYIYGKWLNNGWHSRLNML